MSKGNRVCFHALCYVKAIFEEGMLFSERINGSILHSSARFSRASAFGAARNYRSKNKFLFVCSKNSRIPANFFNFFLFFNRWIIR